MSFFLLALAVWRISSLLVNENGPFDIFQRLRFSVGVRWHGASSVPETELAKVFLCLWCMSFWVGLLIALLFFWLPAFTLFCLMPFALSAVAIVIDKLISSD